MLRAVRNPRFLRAFSLIEVLVCIAVIAVVAAITFPALGHSKQLALSVHDTAHLRQIGVAQALYQALHDDSRWFEVRPLVDSRLLDPSLAASRQDPHPKGLANHIHSSRYRWREDQLSPFKDSYLSYDLSKPYSSFNVQRFEGEFGESRGAGWLVALDRPADVWEGGWFESPGGYQRLLVDGAVVRRAVQLRKKALPNFDTVSAPSCLMYTDDAEACTRQLKAKGL